MSVQHVIFGNMTMRDDIKVCAFTRLDKSHPVEIEIDGATSRFTLNLDLVDANDLVESLIDCIAGVRAAQIERQGEQS